MFVVEGFGALSFETLRAMFSCLSTYRDVKILNAAIISYIVRLERGSLIGTVTSQCLVSPGYPLSAYPVFDPPIP